jgi:VWFA-related protein
MARLNWFVLLMAAVAPAYQQAPNPQISPDGMARFEASAQLVIEAVTVTGKDGKPVEGLTAKDFTVTEDGIPQSVSFCEFQRLRNTRDDPPDTLAAPSRTSPQPALRGAIATDRPGDVRYRDRRLLALYFDLSAMPPADRTRVEAAATKFITDHMNPSDLVAILSFSDIVRVRQDFTGHRGALLDAVRELFLGEAQEGLGGWTGDDSDADYGSAFGGDLGEFNLFNTDRQLNALETAAKMLGGINGKKALVYFASGLRLNGTGNLAQLRATTNAAIRANVSIYTVDARGLLALPPLGDASQGSQGGLAMYTGASAMDMAGKLQRSQDTLFALAADTGGKALTDSNDLTLGIVNAQRDIGSYYMLGYYTTNPALDGRFRRIKVTCSARTSTKLGYRQGYYAGKRFRQFTAAEKEGQLRDALMLGDPILDLTIAAEVNYFQLNSAEYFVPVAVKIPGRELALARRRGAERTVIDFIGEVKDEYMVTLANVRDKVEIKLSGETAAQLARRSIQYDTGFTLLPGTYSLKLLARDNETGRIGTYLTKFAVPNLNKEQRRIPISSVVLSSQSIDVGYALYTAGKTGDRTANPLERNGRKLIPSVTRVFSTSREMYVYLQAYRLGASASQPLFAFVSFHRGGTKAFETPPFAITEAAESRLKTVPLSLDLPLPKLRPGRYACQVTVVDPGSQKAAFWQAPIMLVP